MSIIREKAFAWGIGQADNIEIDKINILQASLLAMRRAFFAMAGKILSEKNNFYRYYKKIVSKTISDGIYTPALPIPCEALIRADATVHAVMAASILAKTARDAEMRRFSALYPEYKYDKHKGYPTKEHKNILAVFGPSPIQRLTFKY